MKEINDLIAGFRRFQTRYFHDDGTLFGQLRHGQQPRTLLIGCSDSRVDPALVTDAAPGDLFVVRNVANLVPPYEPDGGFHGVSSAIEYAVRALQVEHIIVLGHAHCGGIRGLVAMGEGESVGEFIDPWVRLAEPARRNVEERLLNASPEKKAKACELEAILLSLGNLLTFPWLSERVEAGTLALHGWYFDLEAGELLRYSPEQGVFVKLVDNAGAQQYARKVSTRRSE